MRVIKIGGRAQLAPELARTIHRAWESEPALCIVHGGGDEVTAMQRALGTEPHFVNGRRTTTEAELGIVRMVLSGAVNKRLVAHLASAGVPAVGISGEDGGLLLCAAFENGALGSVGEPQRVNAHVLHALLGGGFVPVISPLGRLTTGGGCNVNGDDAAAAIAASLGARELLLAADVPGVLDARGHRIARLSTAEARDLIRDGVATGGMVAKLGAALQCIDRGIARVRIGNVDAIDDLTAGTLLTADVPAHL